MPLSRAIPPLRGFDGTRCLDLSWRYSGRLRASAGFGPYLAAGTHLPSPRHSPFACLSSCGAYYQLAAPWRQGSPKGSMIYRSIQQQASRTWRCIFSSNFREMGYCICRIGRVFLTSISCSAHVVRPSGASPGGNALIRRSCKR